MKKTFFLNLLMLILLMLQPGMSIASDAEKDELQNSDIAASWGSQHYIDSQQVSWEQELEGQEELGSSTLFSLHRQSSESTVSSETLRTPSLAEEEYAFFVKIECSKAREKIVSEFVLQNSAASTVYLSTQATNNQIFLNSDAIEYLNALAREQLRNLDETHQVFSIVARKVKTFSELNRFWDDFSFFEADDVEYSLNVSQHSSSRLYLKEEKPIVGTEYVVSKPLYRNFDRLARLLNFFDLAKTVHVSCTLLDNQLFCSSNKKSKELEGRINQIKSLLQTMLRTGDFSKENFSITDARRAIESYIYDHFENHGGRLRPDLDMYAYDVVIFLKFIVLNRDSADKEVRDFIAHFVTDKPIAIISPADIGFNGLTKRQDTFHSEVLLAAWAYLRGYNQEFYLGNAYRSCPYCLSNLEYLTEKAKIIKQLINFKAKYRASHNRRSLDYKRVLLDNEGKFYYHDLSDLTEFILRENAPSIATDLLTSEVHFSFVESFGSAIRSLPGSTIRSLPGSTIQSLPVSTLDSNTVSTLDPTIQSPRVSTLDPTIQRLPAASDLQMVLREDYKTRHLLEKISLPEEGLSRQLSQISQSLSRQLSEDPTFSSRMNYIAGSDLLAVSPYQSPAFMTEEGHEGGSLELEVRENLAILPSADKAVSTLDSNIVSTLDPTIQLLSAASSDLQIVMRDASTRYLLEGISLPEGLSRQLSQSLSRQLSEDPTFSSRMNYIAGNDLLAVLPYQSPAFMGTEEGHEGGSLELEARENLAILPSADTDISKTSKIVSPDSNRNDGKKKESSELDEWIPSSGSYSLSEEEFLMVLGCYVIKKYLQHEHSIKKLRGQGSDSKWADKNDGMEREFKILRIGTYFSVNTLGAHKLGLPIKDASSLSLVESLSYGIALFTPELIAKYELEDYASYIKLAIVAMPLILNRGGAYFLGGNPFNNWIGTTILTANAMRAVHILPEPAQKIADSVTPTIHLMLSLQSLFFSHGTKQMPLGASRARWFVVANVVFSVADLCASCIY